MQIHPLRGYIQNIFLVEYSHGCLLLDGACRTDFELICNYFAQQLKRPITDLKVVMVTHMHPDHAGCAHYLRKHSGCQIISGSYSQQWYAGVSGKIAHIVDIFLAHWVAGKLGKKRRLTWYPPTLHPDKMLSEGQSIPNFDDWQVMCTPGHTSMDISLVNHTQKLCYVADLIVRIKGELTSPFPVHLPDEYKNSLKRLHELPEYTVMMAHVPSQQISADEITCIISRAPDKPQNIRQVIFNLARKLARFKNQTQT